MKIFIIAALFVASSGTGIAFAQSPSQQTTSPATPAGETTSEQPRAKTKAERREARKHLHAVQRRKIK